ncbi:hypothetical protein [[Clostridium] colinum]|uniref:hypothetical protein n=1 Tax=[Clostridium] colinum TaxID=36835 RepID=UPI0020253AA3|nr:hypothetical protein [[Clostridium] colinum]
MPIFIAVISFIIVNKILLKKRSNGFDKSVDEFIDREKKSNMVIKDFNKLNINFVTPSNNLPFKDYENILIYKKVIKKQNIVKRKVNLEMIKIPSNLTNTELKEMYGINNFDKVSRLEEHYNSYIRALFEWGIELYNIDDIQDCKQVLLEAYRLESNISQVYILLAKIYLKENDKNSLIKLRNGIENIEFSFKDKILQEIDEYIQ